MAAAKEVTKRVTAKKEAARKAKTKSKALGVVAGVATAAVVGRAVVRAVRKRRAAEDADLSAPLTQAPATDGGGNAADLEDTDSGLGNAEHIQY